jgi:hypothetical protein
MEQLPRSQAAASMGSLIEHMGELLHAICHTRAACGGDLAWLFGWGMGECEGCILSLSPRNNEMMLCVYVCYMHVTYIEITVRVSSFPCTVLTCDMSF